MPIQKRTVTGTGKPAESKQSAEANPLKANPFTSTAMKKKNKKQTGVSVTTMRQGRY